MQKDNRNIIMQQILIKVIMSAHHFLDIPNYKFDDVLKICKDVLSTLEANAPNVDAFDNLTKIFNLSF